MVVVHMSTHTHPMPGGYTESNSEKKKFANYKKTANATADAPSATAACHTRASTPTVAAALSFVLVLVEFALPVDDAGAAVEVGPVVTVVKREVSVLDERKVFGSWGPVTGGGDKVGDDAPPVTGGAGVVVPVAPAMLLALAGGGTALEGSARAPVPQGMGALVPGWLALEGGEVAPVGEAIVKRVVHCFVVAPVVENW